MDGTIQSGDCARSAAPSTEEPDDDELVQQFLNGNTAAFGQIVQRHRDRLTTVAKRYARNEHDAEDIMQEAWFKASTSMDTYRAEAKLSTWLHRLVANKAYDYNHGSRHRESPLLDEPTTSLRLHPAMISRPFEHVEHTLIIRSVLAQLPAHHRAALVLVDLLGYSVSEAAQREGVQAGTMKSRRARARERAAEWLRAPVAAGAQVDGSAKRSTIGQT
ncbi:RNA polymerase sigma factor [Corynebacterium tapiri]|uniref:Sigma-70 family RNA polymerase sigma factor n=1 Tax=Corynebacterium tapiri TaxID=1448266 RepID=A0A5C4U4S3_9CORY|nr:sigma-70 family RNA polymerase sigma factor [Corynebacterium tapiri]TNL96866.1 sigma-70 family RNA polymerase sigma factor [Corynebacterium tapiri]